MAEIQGEEDCICGRRAMTRTSWTDENPGRRFLTCVNSRRGGCRFFAWIDPPICERGRTIIPGLLRRINSMEVEITNLQNKNKKASRMLNFSWVMIVLLVALMCFSSDGKTAVAP